MDRLTASSPPEFLALNQRRLTNVLLVLILAVQVATLYRSRPAVTTADVIAVAREKDKAKMMDLMMQIPLVKVEGGRIDVDNTVDVNVENTVDVNVQ